MLGRLEVWQGGERLRLGGPRECALLAALLLRANEIASVSYLVDAVWERPPASPETNVRTYVSQLRRRLGRGSRGPSRLVTTQGGYQLTVRPDEFDVGVFEEALERADAAFHRGHWERATADYSRALDLWRGDPLGDQPVGARLRGVLDGLAERWLVAVERFTRAKFELGAHDEVIRLIRELLPRHFLREELWRLLLLALCGSNRPAEALDAYATMRRRFADELGVEPNERLRQLHEEILRGDHVRDGSVVRTRSSTGWRPPGGRVCQLPADLGDFTERAAPMRQLTEAIGNGAVGAPPVVVVSGGPGVGKSALVLHVAHQLAGRFPDGQLYLDLRGTSEAPRESAVLLAEMLGALGFTGSQVPDGVAARAGLFRSLLSDRRMLVVLDDAADARQVRPLLPAGGGCVVLVTSRQLLTDVMPAYHVELGPLREDEARTLLTRIIGPVRAAAEPVEVTELVRACGHLPLAIRIAAGRLVGRPAWPLRLLTRRLADESRRLTELSPGGLGLRASFQASVRSLPPDVARAFHLLGLLGPHTLPSWVVAPLLDRAHEELCAQDVVDALVDANLLAQCGVDDTGTPRYRLHDLLRAHAVEGAAAIPVGKRRAAVSRVVGVWLDLVRRAVEGMPPSSFDPPRFAAPRAALPPDVASRMTAEPLRWFDAERAALVGAVELAVRWEIDELAWELAATLAPYLDFRSRYDDWDRVHRLAVQAARRTANRRGEAVLLRGIAQVHIHRDEYGAAIRLLSRSRALCRQIGDKRGESRAVAGLGVVARLLDRRGVARDEYGSRRARTALHG
ncbi:AfsR/SARP family transcriptional regulator [Actinophytocola algeriensis]|uniref:DNA-binding SARP family transcriptional activator n=1 Tax=Actinophytocola algeriensis TaxID=1768010 RepID=A0A7W7VHP5_9PSEU|nr:BTAD domain-containing putative transcriptional regulator [Actinophytocola algeriensis]MBB4910651.1 DNA-binding SARP family transcriptional activator [Actinophytocola algeriensis]MBE1473644.1 DNA-binding SARP family transcriptional activator [Actinophytocola algeriensis]